MTINKVVNIYKVGKQPKEYSYWQTKSFEERLGALEQIRQEYNTWRYNAQQGLQRVCRVVKRQ